MAVKRSRWRARIFWRRASALARAISAASLSAIARGWLEMPGAPLEAGWAWWLAKACVLGFCVVWRLVTAFEGDKRVKRRQVMRGGGCRASQSSCARWRAAQLLRTRRLTGPGRQAPVRLHTLKRSAHQNAQGTMRRTQCAFICTIAVHEVSFCCTALRMRHCRERRALRAACAVRGEGFVAAHCRSKTH